jgi:hypothetical protein
LNNFLGVVMVTDQVKNKVKQAGTVPLDELAKGRPVTIEGPLHQLGVRDHTPSCELEDSFPRKVPKNRA